MYVIGFWKSVPDVKLLKSEQLVVNWSSLKIALGFGVTSLSKRTSITGGMNGVGVMVAVSVTEGVLVREGTSVIVGERVIVGLSVMLGVTVMVGEGGKYRYATGSPYRYKTNATPRNNNEISIVNNPARSRWRRIR
jgi:hypothetical protein